MQNSNQYWGTNDREILEHLNGAQFGSTMNENGLFKCQDAPKEGDDEDEEDDERWDDDLDQEDQSDTIETDEDYPGPKEKKIGHEEKPGINDQEAANTRAKVDDSGDENQGNDEKQRSVDENGQRINWDSPELSEADGTEGREVGNHEEDLEQLGNFPDKEGVPDDASIRDLYDTNPNASTIHSSNADRTFGDEKHYNSDHDTPHRLDGENES